MSKIVDHENRDAEMCVIGGMLKSQVAIEEALSYLNPEDFFHQDLKAIFEVFKVYKCPPDQMVVHQRLTELKYSVRSPEILAECLAISSDDVLGCAEIVKEKSTKRQLVNACRQVALSTTDLEIDTEKLVENAKKVVAAITHVVDSKYTSTIKEESNLMLKTLEEVNRTGTAPKLITTGFKSIDRRIGGLRSAELVALAAISAGGKSTMGINLARHFCGSEKLSCAVFSLEMDKREYLEKLYAQEANIPMDRFRQVLTSVELEKMKKAKEYIDKWKMYFDDERPITPDNLIRKIKFLHKRHGLNTVILDYFQLLWNDTKGNEYQHLINASTQLFNLTRELNIVIVALAQAHIRIMKEDLDPDQDSIRSCPKLYHDADLVIVPRRTGPMSDQGLQPMNFYIPKNRFGASGAPLPYIFDGKYAKYTEMTNDFQ